MSYTINLTGATGNVTPITIADGTINTSSTSLTLVGKNWAGYGQFLNQNSVNLLQSNAGSTQPGVYLTGQLWWNTATGILNVYNGTAWKRISGATSGTTAPSGSVSVAGDLWYDSTNAQLNVYTGSAWLLVGPQANSGQGTTGAIPATVTDNTTANHVVLELWTANAIVGMVSKDATFTPGTSVPGSWGTQPISPGFTLSTNVANATFTGNVTGSVIGNATSTGPFTVNSSGNATAIINGATSGVGNIGSSSVSFNTVFAKATTAQYADVAERFAADQVYEAGTVVELGGSAEITLSNTELGENVFGVISTNAAYLMNSAAGTDATHPPVAMTGRVPVRAIGQIRKGDRLVSAGNGLARSAATGEATAFNVIGRALKDKVDTDIGTVEAVVTIK